MPDSVVSDEARRIIAEGVSSMDHVDVLFYLARGNATAADLAAATRFDLALVGIVLADLAVARLLVRNGDEYQLTPNRRDRDAIDDLLAIYNARPVTLVRALYRANI